MSFTKKGRNFRAGDGSVRADIGTGSGSFVAEIALALETEFGGSPSKVKVVARLTDSNERTVKNWFQARNGPNGEGLVALMRHSDGVLGTVLRLAGRDDMLAVVEIVRARERLRETMTTLDRLLGDEAEGT